jgi:hypothetical protein
MSERTTWEDLLDDLWPPTDALAGLMFSTAGDFDRALAFVKANWKAFCLDNPGELLLVISKEDRERLMQAGFVFREVELVDLDTISPQERYEHDLAMIKSERVQKAMAEMLHRPSNEDRTGRRARV